MRLYPRRFYCGQFQPDWITQRTPSPAGDDVERQGMVSFSKYVFFFAWILTLLILLPSTANVSYSYFLLVHEIKYISEQSNLTDYINHRI